MPKLTRELSLLHLISLVTKCSVELLFAIIQYVYQTRFIVIDEYNVSLLHNATTNLLIDLYVETIPFIYIIFFGSKQNNVLNQLIIFLLPSLISWINVYWQDFIYGMLFDLFIKCLIIPILIYLLNRHEWKFIATFAIICPSIEIILCFLLPYFIHFFTSESDIELEILRRNKNVIFRSFPYIVYPIKIGFNIILYNKRIETDFIESFISHELGHLHHSISDTLIGIFLRLSLPLLIMITMKLINRVRRQKVSKIDLLDYYAALAICWLLWTPLKHGAFWLIEWRADSYATKTLKSNLDFLKEQPTINHPLVQLWRQPRPPSYMR